MAEEKEIKIKTSPKIARSFYLQKFALQAYISDAFLHFIAGTLKSSIGS